MALRIYVATQTEKRTLVRAIIDDANYTCITEVKDENAGDFYDYDN